jgi:dimethylaniline monooxygenase (N-oxide forming)
MHSTDFVSSKILAAEDIGYVAVLGAGRSAADMVYACLNSLPPSTQIHWIIREEGTGPGFYAPMDMKTPLLEHRRSCEHTGHELTAAKYLP